MIPLSIFQQDESSFRGIWTIHCPVAVIRVLAGRADHTGYPLGLSGHLERNYRFFEADAVLGICLSVAHVAVALALAPGAASTFTEMGRLDGIRSRLTALIRAGFFAPASQVTYP